LKREVKSSFPEYIHHRDPEDTELLFHFLAFRDSLLEEERIAHRPLFPKTFDLARFLIVFANAHPMLYSDLILNLWRAVRRTVMGATLR
jgi:hypothetical protein